MTGFYIRPAGLNDASALARLQVDSYQSAYAGLLPQDYLDHFTHEEQTQDWQEWLSAPRQDIILVAEEADTGVVGYAVGRVGKTSLEPYDSELLSLHVRAAFQGLGIGRSLFSSIAKDLEQSGCTSLLLWVLEANPARAWYEQLGGKLLGKQRTNLGDEGQPVMACEVAYGWPQISVCKELMVIDKKKVLFLCTGNSCRSQMAEALVNARMRERWEAFSAGTRPAGYVHPLAIQVLAEIGIHHQGRSKLADEYRQAPFDLVVTLCDSAAEECPFWLGQGKRVHLSFPDPAKATGTQAEILEAFRQVRDEIAEKIPALLRQQD